MIAGISALCWLEYRQIVNRVRRTVQQPGRAIVYAIALAYFVFVAVLRQKGGRMAGPISLSEPYASALFFAYVTLLAIMMYGAASGIVGAFSSAADARFLSGSFMPERLVILWLQLRRSGAAMARMIFTLVLYALMFSRSGSFNGIGLAVLGGTLVATASAVPMLKLRRVIGTRTAQSLAGALAACGILPLAILLASIGNGAAQTWAQPLERWGFGYAFNALLDGRPIALVSLYACGGALLALSYAAGVGLYPDLYASSLRVLAFREHQRRAGAGGFTIEHRYEHGRDMPAPKIFGIFRGAWTIVWKEWIAFARSASMRRMLLFGIIVCAGVGALFGHAEAGSKHPIEETLGFAGMAANMIVIFVAMGSAVGLAADISKPLWWMGRDPLWMRLLAWTVGTSWRLAACLAAGIAAWAITLHAAVIALAGIPIAIAAVLYLRAVGLALYSLFPSTLDQRGPLAMVRALLTYILAAPPAIASVVVLFTARTVNGALAAGILCCLLETLLLIAFASVRIAGQGVAIARAESM